MNKIITVLVFSIAFSLSAAGQVGIGTSMPDASAALDVTATDKGLLMPRMTTAQRTAIANPASSLMVFDTDTKSYWSYIDGAWIEDKPGEGKFIDGAAADIAYFGGRVGIGISSFATIHKLYVENLTTADGGNASAIMRGVFDGTGTASTTYGTVGVARNNSTGTIVYAIGSQGVIQNPNNGASITTAVGSYPQIANSGTITYGSGSIIENSNNAGTMATGRGMDVSLVNKSGATMGVASLASLYATNDGSITGDGYGVYIGGQANTGTVGGNSYALYLATPFSNVAGTAWALYSDNVNNSYMAGNLGVGTTNPQRKVHISGVMRLDPQSSEPNDGTLGDLYVSNAGTLFFHDGTGWKAVQLAP
ncbi:MAG: hypothetical protein GY908_08115 [Flavobacteriales bacterium]|nr:hypothetical protein [Flavobacteriales bacterium]